MKACAGFGARPRPLRGRPARTTARRHPGGGDHVIAPLPSRQAHGGFGGRRLGHGALLPAVAELFICRCAALSRAGMQPFAPACNRRAASDPGRSSERAGEAACSYPEMNIAQPACLTRTMGAPGAHLDFVIGAPTHPSLFPRRAHAPGGMARWHCHHCHRPSARPDASSRATVAGTLAAWGPRVRDRASQATGGCTGGLVTSLSLQGRHACRVGVCPGQSR